MKYNWKIVTISFLRPIGISLILIPLVFSSLDPVFGPGAILVIILFPSYYTLSIIVGFLCFFLISIIKKTANDTPPFFRDKVYIEKIKKIGVTLIAAAFFFGYVLNGSLKKPLSVFLITGVIIISIYFLCLYLNYKSNEDFLGS